MVKHPDHVTFVVTDVEGAKKFFALLGFEVARSAVISGPKLSTYMQAPALEADHVTMVLGGASPRFEIQLLRFHRPDPLPNQNLDSLRELGFNHLCFAVDDIEAEVARLTDAGVVFRNEVMEFQNRKLVYFAGPEGITLELAQWLR